MLNSLFSGNWARRRVRSRLPPQLAVKEISKKPLGQSSSGDAMRGETPAVGARYATNP
jgi:hypothetical protein